MPSSSKSTLVRSHSNAYGLDGFSTTAAPYRKWMTGLDPTPDITCPKSV